MRFNLYFFSSLYPLIQITNLSLTVLEIILGITQKGLIKANFLHTFNEALNKHPGSGNRKPIILTVLSKSWPPPQVRYNQTHTTGIASRHTSDLNCGPL